jgi:hypothetical protein
LLQILLDNDYPRIASINLVNQASDKNVYKECKNILYRCVHSNDYSQLIKTRKTPLSSDNKLAIDLLNTLSTIYAIEKGFPVFRCTDGFLRDILSSRLKIRNLEMELGNLLPTLNNILEIIRPREAIMIIDKPIPWSMRLARKIEAFNWANPVKVIVGKCDSLLIELGSKDYHIASSDIIVLQSIKKAVDLPELYINTFKGGLSTSCNFEEMNPKWKHEIC